MYSVDLQTQPRNIPLAPLLSALCLYEVMREDFCCGFRCAEESHSPVSESNSRAAKDLERPEVVDANADGTFNVGQELPEPYQPSPAEVARHNLTHIHHRSCCPPASQQDVRASCTLMGHPLGADCLFWSLTTAVSVTVAPRTI